MSTEVKNVVLAGAGGNLGAPILKALLDAGFNVTVLSRPDSKSAFPAAVKVAKVEYSDVDGLKAAFEGQDALVSAVGFAAFRNQEALIDAAVAAGVKRILPSEYGADSDVPAVHSLPIFAEKVRIQEYVKQKTAGTSTTYSLVVNNEFLDWALDHGAWIHVKEKKVEIFDGGDVVQTVTPLPLVACGVVAVLRNLPATANRVVRIHGAGVTQNKLLSVVQKVTGSDGWKVEHATTEDREKLAWTNLKADPKNLMGFAIPFLQVLVWAPKYEGNFSNNNDNALLGLNELTDAEIEEIVRSKVA